jgi:alpha-beta hydrolase superfamily lysophospholipase
VTSAPGEQELPSGAVNGLGVFSQGLAAAAPSIAIAGVPASPYLVARRSRGRTAAVSKRHELERLYRDVRTGSRLKRGQLAEFAGARHDVLNETVHRDVAAAITGFILSGGEAAPAQPARSAS